MEVSWKTCAFENGASTEGKILGHGVEVYLPGANQTFGFIEGFAWMDKWKSEKETTIKIYINAITKEWPKSLQHELQLAILLFLTDKKRQSDFKSTINGFHFGVNG